MSCETKNQMKWHFCSSSSFIIRASASASTTTLALFLSCSNFALINESQRKRMTIFGTKTRRHRERARARVGTRTIKMKRVMTITVRCSFSDVQYSAQLICVDLFKIFDRNSVITLCAFLGNKFLYFKKMSHFACFRSFYTHPQPNPSHPIPF